MRLCVNVHFHTQITHSIANTHTPRTYTQSQSGSLKAFGGQQLVQHVCVYTDIDTDKDTDTDTDTRNTRVEA
jgi:hypothetical protein